MSLVTKLYAEDMECKCPACGEYVDVEPSDAYGEFDGKAEYYIECPYCGQSFYTHEDY